MGLPRAYPDWHIKKTSCVSKNHSVVRAVTCSIFFAVEIYADVVDGSLDIIANGGNGHKGQDGGDGGKGGNRPQPVSQKPPGGDLKLFYTGRLRAEVQGPLYTPCLTERITLSYIYL